MATKIAIVGSPSCRKTTVAEKLKVQLKMMGYNAEIAAEYARSYIMNYGAPEHVSEQILITGGQIDLEDKLSRVHDIIICDSSSFLGYIYGSMFPIQNGKDRLFRSKLHEMMLEHYPTYDYVFFFPKEEKLREDGIRYQSDEQAELISMNIKHFMLIEGIPFTEISGSVDHKTSTILEILTKDGIIK